MTTVVGVLCQDGVVIGTDSAATFGSGDNRTIEQPTKKIYLVGDSILAGTGQVGLGQRFRAVLEKTRSDGKMKGSPLEGVKTLCREGIADFGSTSAPKGQYAAVVAFPTTKWGPQLCEFAASDFQPELKDERLWWVSLGSAQPITDPFLAFIRRVFWQDGPPSLADAIFAVTWTISHAIDTNPGGVNGPIHIAVMENAGKPRLLDPTELDQHLQNVAAAEQHLRSFSHLLQDGEAKELPRPPR